MVAVAPKKICIQKEDTTVRRLSSDVAAYVIPLQCYIGRGGARKAVCAARGGELVGTNRCCGLRLIGSSTCSYMIAFNPCVMFNVRICLYTGGCRLVFYFVGFSWLRFPRLCHFRVPVADGRTHISQSLYCFGVVSFVVGHRLAGVAKSFV